MEAGNTEIWDENELLEEIVKGLECDLPVRSAFPTMFPRK